MKFGHIEGPLEGSSKGPVEGPAEGPAEGLVEGSSKGPLEGAMQGRFIYSSYFSQTAITHRVHLVFLLTYLIVDRALLGLYNP